MKSLLREVIFPAAGPIGLLAMLIVPPVEAHGEPTPIDEPEAVIASSALPVARSVETARFSSEPGRVTESATPTREQAAAVKPGCDRVSRIGKFTVKRCD